MLYEVFVEHKINVSKNYTLHVSNKVKAERGVDTFNLPYFKNCSVTVRNLHHVGKFTFLFLLFVNYHPNTDNGANDRWVIAASLAQETLRLANSLIKRSLSYIKNRFIGSIQEARHKSTLNLRPPVDYQTDRMLSCVTCRVWSETIRNFKNVNFLVVIIR